MFDLAKKIIETEKSSGDQVVATCGLLYRHGETREQLEEAVNFYGLGALKSVKHDGKSITDTIGGVRYPLLFIEVGDDLSEESDRWRYLLAHDIQVVLVGFDDSIQTMRKVVNQGFYYLLLPVDNDDLGTILSEIREDQQLHRGPQQFRSAMRTAVVGLKGGTGCSMIASELAHIIAVDSGKQVILVDHNYHNSGMSVLLGQQSLERQRLSITPGGHVPGLLDQVDAQSHLYRINSLLSYLGIDADGGNAEELREYINLLLGSLTREANFIIEDYSASVNFVLDPTWLCQLVNCLVVVVEPSLSSMIQTRQFLEKLTSLNEFQRKPARIIVVLNHVRPDSTLDRQAVEQYLRHSVAIELPWVKGCEERLANDQRFYNTVSPLARPFRTLGQVILGKPAHKPSLVQRLKAMW